MNKRQSKIYTRKEILKFANYGSWCKYVTVKKLGIWNDYEVFKPKRKSKQIAYTGFPLVILVKDRQIRWTTAKESIEILKDLDC